MRRALAIADRASAATLWLIGLANILLLLAFLATLLFVGNAAHGAPAACTGTDMLAALEKSDPAKLASIRAEADGTPNGEGLLWRIDKAGTAPSFLFGTMHMTDPRVIDLTPDARKAFDQSTAVVIETTDVLDEAAMMAEFMKNPDLMMFTDDTTLASLMSPDDARAAEAALAKRGIPLASVSKMKPWVLSAMVALPACELARKAQGAPVLDVRLAEQAKAAGKSIAGLETARSQIEAMASLPMEFHVKGLVDTLKLGDRMDDVIETMIVIYQRGETGMFWPFFRAVLPSDDTDAPGYSAFEETMINARNVGMAKNAAAFIDRGGAFIAVGALHLPGSAGLVERLRTAGYTVTRAD
ncbi:MAG: TraB/GumN family protein [Mesorhizobium sp.]|nr:TraB/GumN family protein [Mesorhizobium sp.]